MDEIIDEILYEITLTINRHFGLLKYFNVDVPQLVYKNKEVIEKWLKKNRKLLLKYLKEQNP